jgi:cytochrome b6-f complex iron-sulfur subunit
MDTDKRNTSNRNTEQRRRRSFLNLALGSVGALFMATVLYPIIRYLIPPASAVSASGTILAASADDIKANSGLIFPIGTKPGILIRTPEGELRAFTAVCTHLGCTVQYRPDLEEIWCACHNGHYDLQGRNIAGPPPRPLTRYDVNQSGGKVYVTVRS